VLLHNLPTVFDESKVRTVATIEEVFGVRSVGEHALV
jgi:hypothetical protein